VVDDDRFFSLMVKNVFFYIFWFVASLSFICLMIKNVFLYVFLFVASLGC